jgi:hypothetical protein
VANLIFCVFVLGKTGYSSDYIEEVLHKKKEEKTTLAIDLHRPTYIKVNRKYLHPDTLDAYGLPWEWDGVCFFLLSSITTFNRFFHLLNPFH